MVAAFRANSPDNQRIGSGIPVAAQLRRCQDIEGLLQFIR
jgi:hypothetical protein